MADIIKPRVMRGCHGAIAMGVDPGFASCGFAIVEESAEGRLRVRHVELVQTVKAPVGDQIRVADDDTRRLTDIQRACVRLICEHNPKLIGMETYVPLTGRGGNGAFKVATVYGLVHGLATSANRPVYGFSPQDLRRAFCGGQTGSKADVQAGVARVCHGVTDALSEHAKSLREHMADAIAHAVLVLDHTRAMRRLAQQRKRA